MYFLLSVFIFIFGTLIGSFLNVVIFRHGTGMGLGGRSRCLSSGKVLKWYELIPVLSFILQKGRSRYTGSKLSIQYPLVELVTGFLFLVSFQKAFATFGLVSETSSVLFFVFLALCSVYIILVSVYDIRHMIIPNQFIYPLIVLSVVHLFINLSPLTFSLPSFWEITSGPLTALPFLFLWFISQGRWMGFADAKIAIAMGWFLGVSNGLVAVMLGFWLGAIVGVGVLVYSKYILKKTTRHIPFGPFLLTGLILTFLYNINIGTIITFLYT